MAHFLASLATVRHRLQHELWQESLRDFCVDCSLYYYDEEKELDDGSSIFNLFQAAFENNLCKEDALFLAHMIKKAGLALERNRLQCGEWTRSVPRRRFNRLFRWCLPSSH